MSHHTMLSKYGNCTCVCVCSKLKTSWKSVVFTNEVWKNSRYFVGVFNKTIYYSTRACRIWDGYSQLGSTRLVDFLPSHIQRALVEQLFIVYSWLQLTSIPSTPNNWKPPLLEADISHKQTLGHGLNCLETNPAFFNFDLPFVHAS